MQTILGAGGVIGFELAGVLAGYTDRIRLVSRHPEATHLNSEAYPANLLNAAEVMYDCDHLSPMDESTPVRPCSRKGAVRAAIADALMSAVRRGDIEGLIARCADFYGPGRQGNSVLTQTVFERLAAGKSARWLLSADRVHSFTYTPDAARGSAMLGNADDACGEVWHLPTASAPPTGRGWVEAVAAELGVEPRLQVMPSALLSLAGLVSPTLREIREMAYQYDRDYDFRSEKFERRFGFVPTRYDQGIGAIVEADYR